MIIKVIGKRHFKGTSRRTGNDYDFNSVFFLGKVDNGEGQRGDSVNLDPAMFPYEDIAIGGLYDIEYGPYGRVVDFRRASEK